MYAFCLGNAKVAELLIKKGLNASAINIRFQNSPLQYINDDGIQSGHKQIHFINILNEKKIKINAIICVFRN